MIVKMRCVVAVKPEGAVHEFVKLMALCPSEENHEWAGGGGCAHLDMKVTNEAAHGGFEVGKDYLVDIVPA